MTVGSIAKEIAVLRRASIEYAVQLLLLVVTLVVCHHDI